MKQRIITIFLLSSLAIVSACRKNGTQLNIAQHDAQQIQNYIASNNLTGFVQDSTGGDTSGIYYKILQQPKTDTLLAYSDNISFVFTLKSFDGLFNSTDTIQQNHYQGYLGHIVTGGLPYGLELAILNDLKHYGGSMRILIPSRLAYGRNGYGSGSSQVASSHIAGNQCLDYYVHVICAQHDSATAVIARQNQAAYDRVVINSYLANNALTGLYTYDSSIGVYYRITTPPAIPNDITDNTTAEVTYAGYLLNGTVFDDHSQPADSTAVNIPDLLPGVGQVLKKYSGKGASLSMLIPSPLGYGQSSTSATVTIPPNSPLRFDFTIVSVSP